MTLTAEQVRAWAERLSVLPPCGVDEVRDALGLTGSPVPSLGRTAVEPPPPGVAELLVQTRDGAVSAVQLRLAGPGLDRTDLDAALGPGRDVPRVHPGDPFPVLHHVEVLGGPCSTAVIAYSDRQAGPVSEVVLRRDRAVRTYPGHYAVADVPALVERLTTGEVVASALDLRSGALVRDGAALVRIGRRAEGVEEIPEAVFHRLVAALRRAASHARQMTPMTWRPTGDPDDAWQAQHGGVTYRIVEGDHPVQARYEVLVGGEPVDHLDTWPRAWTRFRHG